MTPGSGSAVDRLYHYRTLLRPAPAQAAAFDVAFEDAVRRGAGSEVASLRPELKPEFLCYLCDWRGFVVHGSPLGDLEVLTPVHVPDRDVTEFGRRDLLFASPDALWSMWFALRSEARGGRATANGCIREKVAPDTVRKRYFFSLPAARVPAGRPELGEGTMYICPPDSFTERNGEEWGSRQDVTPLAKVRVGPGDFPFASGVYGYDAAVMKSRTDADLAGFPWLGDDALYPVRPLQLLIDGIPQQGGPLV